MSRALGMKALSSMQFRSKTYASSAPSSPTTFIKQSHSPRPSTATMSLAAPQHIASAKPSPPHAPASRTSHLPPRLLRRPKKKNLSSDLVTLDLAPHEAPAATAPPIRVHKARLQDARNIFDLVNSFSHDGTLLRRSYAEICENVRDFTVAYRTIPDPETGALEEEFLGCGALHLYGPHLAEVRSIVVREDRRGLGAGDAILESLIAEADDHEVASVCLFT